MILFLLVAYILTVQAIRKQTQIIKKLIPYYEPGLKDFAYCITPVVNIGYMFILQNTIIKILYYEKNDNKLRVFVNNFFLK